MRYLRILILSIIGDNQVMTKYSFYFLVIFVSVFSLTQITYGQNQYTVDDDIFIFVQATLRNSDGHLIAYLESTEITYFDLQALDQFIDLQISQENFQRISLDDNNYQMIQSTSLIEFEDKTVSSSTIFYDNVDGEKIALVGFLHDGYFVSPGDKLELIWTFIREMP